MTFHRDSEQLALGLFPGVPWDGRSPRVLTRAHKGLIFKPRGASREVGLDPQQVLFGFASGVGKSEKAPWIYQGAPSLLPFLNQEEVDQDG